MKKVLLISVPIIVVISIIIVYITNDVTLVDAKNFDLNEEYYEKSEYKEISTKELNNLTNDKKTFVLFVYQPLCIASSNFNAVLDEFLKENKMTIYKISYEDISKTKYKRKIKHYPSFMIFYKGELVNYLDADKDSDIDYFKKTDEFKTWLSKYVNLRENNFSTDNVDDKTKQIEELKQNKIDLKNITKETGKVNIYLFWGEGCPHCKKEKEFLSSITEEYGKYFNLYTYEVWNNLENANIFKTFGAYNNELVKGVPYMVIGEKTFTGFDNSDEEEILNAIIEESQKDYDIYLDKIKSN